MPEFRSIHRAFFREADDGTTIFFPWGLAHRGYRLTHENAKETASRATSVLIGAVIAIGSWIGRLLQVIVDSPTAGDLEILALIGPPGGTLLLVFTAYSLWASRFVERFAESDLTVPREKRVQEAAELVGPWKVALFGVVSCGLSGLWVWLQPHAWWVGVPGLALGMAALFWGWLLRRARAAPSEPAA